MKKGKEIEKLLQWAYGEELPKEPRRARPGDFIAAWGAIAAFGETLAVVDEPNIYGVIADPFAETGPHPDALALAAAVADLDDFTLGDFGDWEAAAGLGLDTAEIEMLTARALWQATVADREGRTVLKKAPRRLIEYHAIMGGCPDWTGEPAVKDWQRAQNGQPKWFRRVRMAESGYEYEADGWCGRTKRPHRDAYRKPEWRPDPVPAIVARAEYQVWRAALDVIAAELAGRLAEHEVFFSARPWAPWEESGREARILPDLRIGWRAG